MRQTTGIILYTNPMAKLRVPAVEGMFTMDFENPTLIGGKGTTSQSYYFPKDLSGGDPKCVNDELREEVYLSSTAKIWSYTSANYPPTLPYQIKEPFEPFLICAALLQKESLVICGQMMPGVGIDDLEVGLDVKLALDVLFEDDEYEHIVWKWDLL